jgi:spermidine synthase
MTMHFSWLRARGALPILTLLSGASALIYEVGWFRLLSLSFGVSVYAASAVLIAFMGGLALGSWLVGRRADGEGAEGRRAALRLYAALQIGIGLYALATPFLFAQIGGLYLRLDDLLAPDRGGAMALRLLLALLVLLPPTTLMGGSFPALSRAYTRSGGARGRDLGLLYALNIFGGVSGALAAGLGFIPLLGVTATIWIAGALDLLAGIVGIVLVRGLAGALDLPAAPVEVRHSTDAPRESRRKQRRAAATRAAGAQAGSGGRVVVGGAAGGGQAALSAAPAVAAPLITLAPTRVALIGFALSGFASLGYQVVWTRLLAIFSLNAIYSFTVMLATFLTGLALGSLIGRRRADRAAQPLALFGWLQVAIAISGVLVLFVFARLPTLLELFTAPTDLGRAIWAEFFAAGVTMLLPTILIGATFPAAVRLYVENDATLGARVGRLYAFNTLGAMLGAFAAGFILIPLIGLQRSALLLALINMTIGALALLALAPAPRLRLAGAAVVAALLAALLPPGVYLGFREGVIPQLVFYREGIDATVAVFEVKNPPLKISFVNGRNEVPTDRDSMQAFYLLGHLPPLLKPDAESALMISFGNGIATGAMATHAIPRIRAVELVAEQVAAAELYRAENRNVLDYPGLDIVIEDGRNYLLRSDERYPIITADATHPINSSSWALFTREFYTLVQQHMTDDGVFVQWLPFHDLHEDDFRAIVATFNSVFPNATVWYTGGTHCFLVATPGPLTHADVAALEARMAGTIAAADLGGAADLAEDLIMEDAGVDAYTAGAPIIVDDTAFFIPARHVERIVASFPVRTR